MAKWHGQVGYATTAETSPGVWTESIVDRDTFGDLFRNTRRLQSAGVNDNVVVSNEISFVADPFANENFHAIRYATFMGTKWKATNVDVQYPRIIVTLGEVYNG